MEDKIIMKGCCFMEIRDEIYLKDNRCCKWYEGEFCNVKTVKGDIIEGQIISINPKSNLVMINPPTKYIEILNVNDIEDIWK